MSAFGGYCFWDGRPVTGERLALLADHLRLGGPDGGGTVQPAPWLALQAHLLHFDTLAAGESQPHRFAHGSVLTWDGRLDNREDLLLSLHRHLGADRSDAALVAAAYERWGVDAFPRLIGDWCVAIWDASQQRLVLARDYMGTRPLYYRVEADRLVWATRLEALAACEQLFGTPDDVYIAGYLTQIGVPTNVTPFQGIAPLLAGHVLIGTREGPRVRRYWTYAPATLRYRHLDQYAEHLRILLTDAVRVRLRSTRRVWAHLSGGWDSSSVVCLAHRLIAQGEVEAPAVKPLSIVYNDTEARCEREFMAAVERWCGVETEAQLYRGRPLFAEMLGHRVPVSPEEPFELESPLQRVGDHVVLTGMMGDMTTGRRGGNLRTLWEPFDNWQPLLALRGFATYAHANKRPLPSLLVQAISERFGPDGTARRPLRATQHPLSGPGYDGVAPELLAKAQTRRVSVQPLTADLPRAIRSFVDGLYKWAERGSAAAPEHFKPVVWRTHPFLHRPLIEFMCAIPSAALFDPLFARAGMRRALADVLPPAILERETKVGIVATAHQRWRAREPELMKDAPPLTDGITSWRLVQRGVVLAQKLADDINTVRRGSNPSKFLYHCLCMEAWLRSIEPAATASPLHALQGRSPAASEHDPHGRRRPPQLAHTS